MAEPTDGAPRSDTSLESSAWGLTIPWIMTGMSLLVLCALAWFLIENIYWFRLRAFPVGVPRGESFTLYTFHLHLAMVKRSVGLFAGFSLIFIGTAVAFFSLDKAITLGGSSSTITGNLTTASPGIVAMLLGAVLIMFVVSSKDQFDPLPPAEDTGDVVASPPALVRPGAVAPSLPKLIRP